MAPVPTFAMVTYLDNANRRSTLSYRLAEAMEDDGSNVADVIAAADDLETALNVLTEGKVETVMLQFQSGGGGAAPNIHANNQNVAFTRTFTADGGKSSFEVPAWDDTTYAQDENNLLSAAYNTAAEAVQALLLDPITGSAMTEVRFSQARTRRGARHIN